MGLTDQAQLLERVENIEALKARYFKPSLEVQQRGKKRAPRQEHEELSFC